LAVVVLVFKVEAKQTVLWEDIGTGRLVCQRHAILNVEVICAVDDMLDGQREQRRGAYLLLMAAATAVTGGVLVVL